MKSVLKGVILLVFLNIPLVPKNVFGLYWAISKTGWLQLESLQDYICALTLGTRDENRNSLRCKPWFCVPSTSCDTSGSRLPRILNGSKSLHACNSLRYNEGHDTCCYIGRLRPRLDVQSDDYSTFLFIKNKSIEGELTSLDEYKEQLLYETSSELDNVVLTNHEVCGLFPVGVVDDIEVYDVYLCMEESQCTMRYPFAAPLKFGTVGDMFCSRGSYSGRNTCCHKSALVNTLPSHWYYKELLPNQSYAPGFKSAFMCEQYNRFVCDGKHDRCALRILDRFTSVPGEFPHQALIGVSSHRIQFFHCAGSLISKYFIISALGCKDFEGFTASIALLGEYNIKEHNEYLSREQIIYIRTHYSDYAHHNLLLLRLWRPAKLNYLVRPACLAFFSKTRDFNAQHEDFGSAWLTGYGPINRTGKFNETLKRYQFNYLRDLTEIKKCRINNLTTVTEKSHLCIEDGILYSPRATHTSRDIVKENVEGDYDMGAPFNILNSYCQWSVYGVAIEDPTYRAPGHTPTLIETIPRALKWIESIVWKNDFDLLEYNLTLPDCATDYTFFDMFFLKKNYTQHV